MKAVKPRRGVDDARMQRVNLRLTTECYRRLAVHALMSGMTPGRLVEDLVNRHLREFRVQTVRAGSVATEDRRDPADDVSRESLETVAA
jgi:hypothetical protein